MVPPGFQLSATQAGIKYPGRTDMALIYSETDAAAAASYTTSKVKGAALVLGMKRIRSGRARAIVINSGNANTCTGTQGLRDAEETAARAALGLGIPERLAHTSSTGVIGVPLPMERVREGVDALVAARGTASLEDLARAIMTTDTFPKFLSRKLTIGKRTATISAVAKGAGMIAPNMATLLSFVMTDLAIEPRALKAALRHAVEYSFNRITIDGDRSTCDTAFAMAGGALGNKPLSESSRDFGAFRAALTEMLYELSRLIVRDGEGATKLIEVDVRRARSDADARRAALAIANSLLVKTAIYGRDPNWGRIMAAIGYSGAAVDEARTTIDLAGVRLYDRGTVTGRTGEAESALAAKDISIVADLGLGKGSARVLTCDLTENYIKINAEYTT